MSYNIYSVGAAGKLESVVIVNMDMFNATMAESERSSVVVTLPTGAKDLKRLTARGADVKSGVSYGGQTVNDNAEVVGDEVREAVNGGIVEVKASEAVLVRF